MNDAELVRSAMVPRDNSSGVPGRWSIFGQSFGGFCAVHYLSAHPHALTEALLTGGLPPGISQHCSAETAYHCLFRCLCLALSAHCVHTAQISDAGCLLLSNDLETSSCTVASSHSNHCTKVSAEGPFVLWLIVPQRIERQQGGVLRAA